MPNGQFRNWSRLARLVGAFEARRGRPPERVEVPVAVWGDLRRLFSFDGFRALSARVPLVAVSGESAPCATGDGARLAYLDIEETAPPADGLPFPDRLGEEPDLERDQRVETCLAPASARVDAFFHRREAHRAQLRAIARDAGVNDGAADFLADDQPPFSFSGDPRKPVPYVLFSLNPKLSAAGREEARAFPDAASWWRLHRDYFAEWAQRPDRRSARLRRPVAMSAFSHFWSVATRLVFGLEGIPLPGKPGAHELRILGELVVNVDVLPYASRAWGTRHTRYVREHPVWMDQALALGRAVEPELLIFNGAPFRPILAGMPGIELGPTRRVADSGLTLTLVRIDARTEAWSGILLNQFVGGAAAHVTNENLATDIPTAIREVLREARRADRFIWREGDIEVQRDP